MGLAAYNPNIGQIIKTDAGVNIDHAFLAHYMIAAADADAAGVAAVVASTVLADGAITTLTGVAIAQPPTPRVLSITGNAATAVGNVVITGTDFAGEPLVETIVSTGAATVLGTKAFASISSIVLPAQGAVADEISVGLSDKFGIPYMLPNASRILLLTNNGVATTPAVTSGFSATVLADNFIDPTAALAGAQVDVYFLV